MSFELPKNSPLAKKDFVFGVATAAFQIEGANTADGRCESIWDRFCATEGKVLNGDDGSIACDHYNRLEDDLDLIASLGVDAYRFSVAWPRIEPAAGQWNEAGFAFYQRLIDGLKKRNIKPYLTLYHWDLPQYLDDKGGWLNRETAYAFATYAEKVAERFGDQVVSYCTFNEPWCSAILGYRWGHHAPGFKDDRMAFQAGHHLLLAHGLALPALRKHAPKAECGIVLNFAPAYPATDSAEDQRAADIANDCSENWFLHPLMTGEYPANFVEQHPDCVPIQMPDDMDILTRKMDFVGINFYTRNVFKADENGLPEHIEQTAAAKTDIGWEIYPDALTYVLTSLPKRYKNLPALLVTENGAADNTDIENGEINDTMRTDYYQRHLNAVHNAIEQGANVTGYFAWSLMDNFEWAFGYSQRFGIVHVNYDTQVRTLKKSGKTWQSFLSERKSK